MATSWRRLRSLNSALFPQLVNVKQGRLGKLYNIIGDYGQVLKQIAISGKEKPIKSFIYLGGIASVCYIWKNNPDESSYLEQLIESSNELLLVSDLIRSKRSNRYVRELMDLHTRDCLSWKNLGFFSVILRTPHGKELDLYEKHCYYVQPRWLTIQQRIVDYGFCGRWFNLEKAMIDYDVNEDEFPEEQNLPS